MKISRRGLIWAGVIALLVVAAAIPALQQIPTSQPVAAPVLKAQAAAGALPADPWAADWAKAPSTTMPLSVVNTPGANTRDVKVSAITDNQQIAFRLEWTDDSQETLTIRPEDFADAAAIQLADSTFNICMGQTDRYAHIWHWKADWEHGSRDLKAQYPNMYRDDYWNEGQRVLTEDVFQRPAATVDNLRALPAHETPVEHAIAGGFQSLTSHAMQNVSGSGIWQDGKWAVVFVRDLARGGEGDFSFAGGEGLQVAFAVWDGKLMQRDGMKYVSTWASLELPPAAVAAARAAESAVASR